MGLISGGAVGNAIDRLRNQAVVDFIDVELWNGIHFPSFNIADSSLSLGAFLIVVYWIYTKYFAQNDTEI